MLFLTFFLIVKSSISPLIFISITYYYYIYFFKTFFFFKAKTIYSLWMVVDGFFFLFDCSFVYLFFNNSFSFFFFVNLKLIQYYMLVAGLPGWH